jgi:TonB family protein
MMRFAACALLVLMAANQRGPAQDFCPEVTTTRVWSPITPAVVTSRVEPKVSFGEARGPIVLDVWIDEKGRVTCVRVTRSIPLYNQGVIDAVRQWRFTPATLAGTPVAVVQQVVIKTG